MFDPVDKWVERRKQEREPNGGENIGPRYINKEEEIGVENYLDVKDQWREQNQWRRSRQHHAVLINFSTD